MLTSYLEVAKACWFEYEALATKDLVEDEEAEAVEEEEEEEDEDEVEDEEGRGKRKRTPVQMLGFQTRETRASLLRDEGN